MTEVTATEFARNFGRCCETAQRKPVAPMSLAVEKLDGATLKALAVSRMDQRHDQLDALTNCPLVATGLEPGLVIYQVLRWCPRDGAKCQRLHDSPLR